MLIAADGTGYTAIARQDGTYSVEVVRPGDLPEMIHSFATEAEADRYILSKVGKHRVGELPDVTTAAQN
jgi:hypothetical protein